MQVSIKMPSLTNHELVDDFLKREDEIMSDVEKGLVKEIIIDLSEAGLLSVANILFIARILHRVKPFDVKCFAKYCEDEKRRGLQKFFIEIMVAQKSKVEEVEKYLDTIRVPLQVCHNATESLSAVNKLIPIIRDEYHPTEPVIKALNWILWEVIDNAGVHGYQVEEFDRNYQQPVFFCSYDAKEFIDIAILDMGQGIHNSFLRSGKDKYKGINNEEALRLAIQDKESGNPKGSPGFGLYGCAEIVRQTAGRLVIISGASRLVLNGRDLNVSSCYTLRGTLVTIRIPVNAAVDLKRIFGDKNLIVSEELDIFGDFNESK